jgi:hypothetical protein
MKILYIHGLESRPSEEKNAIFTARGHQIWSPDMKFLDFVNTSEPYEILKNIALKNEVDFLVGSSYGGFMAFWLGQELALPQLLFNPALFGKGFDVPTSADIRADVPSWVFLGAVDDVVPASTNIEFFADKQQARVVVAQWLGHRIDVQTMREAAGWAGL